MQILVVEDEQAVADVLSQVLGKEGYQVRKCASVETAERLIEEKNIDPQLLILDLMLPGIDGITAIPQFRSLQYKGPILILTGRSETSYKVNALDAGADDYLLKPFSTKELLARVRALLRRSDIQPNEQSHQWLPSTKQIEIGDMVLDPGERRVSVGDNVAELTDREFHLLQVLASHKDRAVSRQFLLEEVWGDDSLSHNTVDVHVKNLRKKLQSFSDEVNVETVRGIGYRLSSS